MTDTDGVDQTDPTITEGDIPDETPEGEAAPTEEPETFPSEVVKDLRKENAKYRQRAQQSDALAQRLHAELVRATGRLADPADLPFSDEHLADPDTMTAAINELLEAKPHLASRRPLGDIGQGQRGGTAQPFNLLQALKDRV